MRTVIYFDYARNKKSFLRNLLAWVMLFFLLFVISLLLEHFLPDFNNKYLKWPDMVQNFLGTTSWNRRIYVNLWYLVAIIFSICMVYIVMTGFAQSLIQEERLETIAFLQNLSLSRAGILFAKLVFWSAYAFVTMGILLLENIAFLAILKSTVLISFIAKYYGILFVTCLIYLALAAFMASYSKDENVCSDHITEILLISVVLSKIEPFVRFVVDLMEMKEYEGEIIRAIEKVADKLNILNVLCPAVWSWPGVQVSDLYLGCGIGLAVIMGIGAFWIYRTREKVRL